MLELATWNLTPSSPTDGDWIAGVHESSPMETTPPMSNMAEVNQPSVWKGTWVLKVITSL